MGGLGKGNLLHENEGKFLGSGKPQTVLLILFYVVVNAYTPSDLHISCLHSKC